MNPLNPFFAIIIYSIAFLTAYLINLKYKVTNVSARYENIDSLRGFLALGVFIHHSAVWFQYLHIKSWEVPKSNLFNQLGQTSIAFFFMITAFLFITKLLNTGDKKFNWNALYISRVFRLVPMYLVSIVVLVSIVSIISAWELKVGTFYYLKTIFKWTTFTIFGSPDINDSVYTSIINAGVVWSLPYEWLFYFMLPLIALIILKNKPPKFYILVSLLFAFIFYKFKEISPAHFVSFIGGAIAPFIIKYGPKKINYNSVAFSILIIVCLGSILLFRTSNNWICKILIIVVFNLIALGNNIFRILKSSTLKFLGEICYSTYLMHGIIIFVVMYFGLGLENATRLSPLQFCLTIFIVTPFVVIISFLGFKYVEKPFMLLSKKFTFGKIKHHTTRLYKNWNKALPLRQ